MTQLEQRSQRILVEGDHNVAKLFPMWGTGAPLYLWAENGRIHWEDARTNHYGTMSVRDACHRVVSLSELAFKSSEDPKWQHERRKIQQFVCDMENVIRQAKTQGEPFPNGATVTRVAERRRQRAEQAMVRPRKLNRICAGDDF